MQSRTIPKRSGHINIALSEMYS